jgi:DNA (cytosine-5)-methyltransferase 1
MVKPRLLDLFCGAGGAAMGYHRAGFDVTGVDIAPQPRYPFTFYQSDALEYVAAHGHEFDAIHASPPCQKHTALAAVWRALDGYDYDSRHKDLIDQARRMLKKTGKPWIIENVEGAPLASPVVLCGTMFGLRLFRHRIFETSFFILAPWHTTHARLRLRAPRTSRQPVSGEVWSIYGHFSGVEGANEAMECGWMTQGELAQAIPPAYTEFIGRELMRAVFGGQV